MTHARMAPAARMAWVRRERAQRRIAAVARHLIARGEIFVNDAVEETSLKLRLPREKVA